MDDTKNLMRASVASVDVEKWWIVTKFLPTLHLFAAKAKFAQAREWDNKVVWGDEGL
jgi:hypothetical protein